MSYPQGPGAGPQPPAPQVTTVSRTFVLITLAIIVAFCSLCCALVKRGEDRRAPSGPIGFTTPPQPIRVQGPLAGVAVFSTRGRGITVCSRRDLHGCRVSRGENVGFGPTTIDWPESDIAALVSCDDIGIQAVAACPVDAGHATVIGSMEERAPCERSRGLFARVGHTIRDPRDPQLEPGQVVVDCMEGQKRGTFDE
jgi:hypothetical protein